MDEAKIVLAGQEYTIAPLTLRQIKALRVAIVLQPTGDAQRDAAADMDRSVDIVAAAIGKTRDELYDLTISQLELINAVNSVLDISGLIPKKAAPAGESAAAA